MLELYKRALRIISKWPYARPSTYSDYLNLQSDFAESVISLEQVKLSELLEQMESLEKEFWDNYKQGDEYKDSFNARITSLLLPFLLKEPMVF